MKGKRGQVAVEYLTTYGWVILVVVIGIGAITYFGLLQPSRFVPNKCWTGPQLVCEDYILNYVDPTETDVLFKLRNNMKKDILVTDVTSLDPNLPLAGCTLPDIGVSSVKEISCDITTSLFQGQKYSLPVQITFRRNESVTAPLHIIVGEIYSVVI